MAREISDERGRAIVSLLKTACVFLAVLAAVVLVYKLYDAVFPYAKASLGICRHCGEGTQLKMGGWAPFCARHTPHFALIQVLSIVLVAVLMLVCAISFWLILRGVARWGSWRESIVLVILCAGIAVMFVVVTQHRLTPVQHFFGILVYYIFVLSAVFIDRLESVIILSVVAVAASAVVAFIIQIAFWVFVGYQWK